MLLVTFDRPASYMNQPTNKKETNFLDKIGTFTYLCWTQIDCTKVSSIFQWFKNSFSKEVAAWHLLKMRSFGEKFLKPNLSFMYYWVWRMITPDPEVRGWWTLNCWQSSHWRIFKGAEISIGFWFDMDIIKERDVMCIHIFLHKWGNWHKIQIMVNNILRSVTLSHDISGTALVKDSYVSSKNNLTAKTR